MSNNPDFEEGPFFIVTSPMSINLVWATDEHTAVFAANIADLNIARTLYIGGLEDAKQMLHLTSPAITDLHRDGRLRLVNRVSRPVHRF